MKSFLALATIYILSFAVSAQDLVTLESLRSLPTVSSPRLSPDDQSLLYAVNLTDIKNNTINSQWFLLDIKSGTRQKVFDNISDPQWSADGMRMAFKKAGALHIVDFRDGEFSTPSKLVEVSQTRHFLGHPTKKNYAWSPDGKYIAYVAADPSTGDDRSDPNAPVEIDRTMYKTRTGFSDNKITRIYLVDVASGSVKNLTPGGYDSHSLTWSPNSKTVAFLSNRSDNPDHNYNNDLWTVDINSGSIRQLTETVGTEHDPNWSPDGKWISYPATIRPVNTKDSPPENTFIYALSTTNGERINLTVDFDRRSSSPRWHPSNGTIYFSARNHGNSHYYNVKPGQEVVRVTPEMGMSRSLQVGKKKLVYIYMAPGQPGELYISDLDGSDAKQITSETAAWSENKVFSKVEDYWFKSHDGTMVQGFIAYPPNVQSTNKIPVIHRIHGGPHGMYGRSFDTFTEMLVAQGYAVVFINPRGSTGYGQKFADGTYQAWGGGDYKDLMLGMDEALEKYPFLDEDKMGVTGGSYGGFMTNWVVTQTDRYKGAATSASVSNLISFYGTSLYQLLIETEFNGLPWDNYGLLWHFSPMAHIKNVTTPTLLVHGELDMDVPITQAEEFYIGLKKRGIPARFVRYPNEGHGVRQPQHREHYYQEIFNWFEKYVKGDEGVSLPERR